MLDIKFIRENTDAVKKALTDRGVDLDMPRISTSATSGSVPPKGGTAEVVLRGVAYLVELDEKRRMRIKEVDDLRAQQNQFAEEISRINASEREKKISESKEVKVRIGKVEGELRQLEEKFNSMMHRLPNIPLEDAPVGKDDSENVVVREVGQKPEFGFKARDYMEIATGLDLIDTERAAKVSGSRFGYLKNEAVLLEFALVQFAFEKLRGHGFIPIVPPVIIKEDMLRSMGYIDSEKDVEERYYLKEDKQYLVGTSEQSIVPMHADETLTEAKLPYRYAGFSSCFRREAGSYGKDTHGILRVHQFDKVEMVSFSKPENSSAEHNLMIKIEEELMQELNIAYRVVALCTGDLSQPSAKTIDIESWLPGQKNGEGEYRETHSSSNTTDYQARRLNIKFREALGKSEFVHILNGTAFAIGRTLIAILENYQQEDGSVKIPEVLQPYMGGMKIITRQA